MYIHGDGVTYVEFKTLTRCKLIKAPQSYVEISLSVSLCLSLSLCLSVSLSLCLSLCLSLALSLPLALFLSLSLALFLSLSLSHSLDEINKNM